MSLPLEPVPPKVTKETLGKTIAIDLSTNTLRLRDGFEVIRSYDVGTAMAGCSTPAGSWEVVDKGPTWYNRHRIPMTSLSSCRVSRDRRYASEGLRGSERV